jgi:hypothetical protein
MTDEPVSDASKRRLPEPASPPDSPAPLELDEIRLSHEDGGSFREPLSQQDSVLSDFDRRVQRKGEEELNWLKRCESFDYDELYDQVCSLHKMPLANLNAPPFSTTGISKFAGPPSPLHSLYLLGAQAQLRTDTYTVHGHGSVRIILSPHIVKE